MRKWIGILALLFLGQLQAQDTDTTIYNIVAQKPLFPGCAEREQDTDARTKCTNQSLLSFMYSNLVYPADAVRDSLEGTVVIRFVVEKNGRVGQAEIMKDIGGGCGEEALRVLDIIRQADEANWTPGLKDGQPVRTYFTLPIRFKVPEPPKEPDFYLLGRDTIHVKWDSAASYRGGLAALGKDITTHLKYPEKATKDCLIGELEFQVLVAKDGRTFLVDLLDYSDLGIDFWYEGIALLNKHLTTWEPAIFEGKPVNTMYAFRIRFNAPGTACANRVSEYDRAKELSEEAVKLFEGGDAAVAIEKWNAAVGLFPKNAEFLSYRGQAHMDSGNFAEACADFTAVKQLMWVSWYEQLLPILCNRDEEAAAEEEDK